MIRISSSVIAGFALCLMAGAASAQTPAPAPATPPAAAPSAMAPAGKMAAKPRTAQSIACSADADKQGLHGKPRKTFMSSCKHKAM